MKLDSDSVFGKIFKGSRNERGYEFGRTYVVRPKGKHQATLVWLHGLGDNGSRYHSSHDQVLKA